MRYHRLMLEWLIVGGGVHGTYLSHYLTQLGRVPRDTLRVLDPHVCSFARWDRWTANTATDYLRSPDDHHVDVQPESLARFATTLEGRAAGGVVTDGRRPAVGLFRAHADEVRRRYQLDALRLQGTATALTPHDRGWRIETMTGALEARHVMLAIGPDDTLPWPQWARTLCRRGAPIDHVLDPTFVRSAVGAREHVVVIGGGISAAQLALALTEREGGEVTLIARHSPRVHALDADLPWFGRGEPAEFAREADQRQRRNLLGLGRHRGSMPRGTASRLDAAIRTGRLGVRVGEIARAAFLLDHRSALTPRLRIETADHAMTCDRIVLATGFSTKRPGGTWLTRSILAQGLPTAPCGYPVADAMLAWRPGLHVCGPLAELQLGAAARSIAGARRAAEIIGNVT